LLHIDIDGACTHICKAIGTKAVVLYGPTSAKIIGYPENINITSSICRDCYHKLDHKLWGKCPLGYEKSLCMESIKPQFVAQKAIEYLKGLDVNTEQTMSHFAKE
jgi:ADP-heptose:LPS heptosyltransferase